MEGEEFHSPAARRLLLVEDNPADAELIKALLEKPGWSRGCIQHVRRLANALATLQVDSIDAVLLALRLPDAEGIEGVRAIRALTDDVPIVVLTGPKDEALGLRCIHSGAQDYLVKDRIDSDNLRRAIAYALARVQVVSATRRAGELRQELAAIVASSSDAMFSFTREGLIEAIEQVLAGGTELDSVGRAAVASSLREDTEVAHHKLSGRELQIFRLIALGFAVKEVASELDLSAKTVATYLARIRDKTGLSSHVGIARYAMQHGLVD